MRADEIRDMSLDDVAKKIREFEEERFRLNFRSATEPLEDPLRLRVIRRDIARLKTVLGEQRRAGQGSAATPTEPKTPAASAGKPARKPARAARG